MKKFSFPLSCEWNITNNCNMNCVFCSMGCKPKNDFNILTLEHIEQVAEKIREVGCLYVSLSGGEPLSHPLIYDIIRILRSKNLEVTLTTNGTLINEESLRKFTEYDVRWIQISLHSDNKLDNDRLMGGNAFTKIWNAINLIRNSNIGISVCSVDLGENQEAISSLRKQFKDLNIPYYIKTLLPIGRAEIKDTNKDINNIHVELKRENKCSNFFAIMPDGGITPCGEFGVSAGNIFYDDLKDVLENNYIFRVCDEKARCFAVERIYNNSEVL